MAGGVSWMGVIAPPPLLCTDAHARTGAHTRARTNAHTHVPEDNVVRKPGLPFLIHPHHLRAPQQLLPRLLRASCCCWRCRGRQPPSLLLLLLLQDVLESKLLSPPSHQLTLRRRTGRAGQGRASACVAVRRAHTCGGLHAHIHTYIHVAACTPAQDAGSACVAVRRMQGVHALQCAGCRECMRCSAQDAGSACVAVRRMQGVRACSCCFCRLRPDPATTEPACRPEGTRCTGTACTPEQSSP